MSNRLESLNSKTKPALKFKPKAVARKSKEDREKDARLIKTEDVPRASATRGRGGARGGRGRGGSLAGTHMVSTGPLSMGSVALSEQRQTKMSYRPGTFNASDELSNTALLAKMTLKARSNGEEDPVDSDEDDHKAHRINMSKEYAYADSETTLFPVRPTRDAENTPEGLASASEPVLAILSAAPSRAQTVDSVKSEAMDGVAPELPPLVDVAGDLARAEYDRMIDDQRSILDFITSKLGTIKTEEKAEVQEPDGKYMLFQMPQIQPTEYKITNSRSPYANNGALIFEGQVGNLNFHKSGKISITMADGSVLDCSKGSTPSFLQEVYMIDALAAKMSPEELENEAEVYNSENVKVSGDIHRLGEIVGKIVAKPSI